MHKIRITRTEVVEYEVNESGGADFYRDHEVVNIDQAAVADMEGLKENNWGMSDLAGNYIGSTYMAEIITYDGDLETNRRAIDENNTTRDEELFPEDAPLDQEVHEKALEELPQSDYDQIHSDGMMP